MANQKLLIDIIANDKSKQPLNGVQKSLGRLKQSVFNLRNAFIGLGAGLVIRNLVNTGKEIENLRVRLKFLLKNTNEGAKAFENMTKFASKVPFSLEEISRGSGILATVTDNADDLQKMLEITGNVAAVTGLDFQTSAEQIQRSFSAGIGAADLFREKGVRNMLGFKAGATVSIEATVEAFEKTFGKGGRFGKATDELAETFQGTLSMIGDKVFNFKKVILEAGLFETLKKEFGKLDVALAQNAELIEKIGVGIGTTLALGVEKLAQSIKLIAEYSHLVKETFKILISYKLAKLFLNIGRSLITVVSGMSAIAALSGPVGIGLAAAAAAAGTAAYYLLGKQLDSIAEKIEENHKKFKESKRVFTGGGFDAAQYTKKDLFDISEVEKLIAEAKEKELKLQNFLLDEANKKRRRFHELETEGLKTFKEMNVTFKDMNENSLTQLKEKFTNIGTTIKENLNAGITSFSNALSRSLILGEDLGKAFKSMVQDALIQTVAILIEIVIRMGIQKLLGDKLKIQEDNKLKQAKNYTSELKKQVGLAMLLAFFTGGSSMGFGGFGGGSTPKRNGGSVQKDQPYMVGEQGPELFVPNSSGQITQSARGTGGGGNTNVNFTINATDVRGVKELLIDNRATIVNVINSALNEKGKEALV